MSGDGQDPEHGSSPATERARRAMIVGRAALAAGDLAGAADAVGDAAEAWSSAGQRAESARCLRLAAALTRHDGRTAAAVRLAREAVAAAPDADRAAALVELARAEAAAGDGLAAVADLDQWGVSGRLEVAQLEESGASEGKGTDDQPVGPLVDAVGLLTELGRPDLADRLADRLANRLADPVDARPVAATDEFDRHAVRSQLALLAAGRSVADRDLSAALGHAVRARTEALAGRAPTCYVAAAYAIAALQETDGDEVGAYGTLASGWVTVTDLLGGPIGQAAFAPALVAFRDRLGPEEFGRVRAAYEKTRTAA